MAGVLVHIDVARPDDAGAWSSVEAYVTRRADVAFSHGICPACFAKHVDDT